MKTKLPLAITTIEEAKILLTALNNNGEAFHPEDDANECFDTLTKEECDQLNKLMGDIYNLDGNESHLSMIFDPCEYLLMLDGMVEDYEAPNVPTIVQTATGAEFEVTNKTPNEDGYFACKMVKLGFGKYKRHFKKSDLGATHNFHTSHLEAGFIYYKAS